MVHSTLARPKIWPARWMTTGAGGGVPAGIIGCSLMPASLRATSAARTLRSASRIAQSMEPSSSTGRGFLRERSAIGVLTVEERELMHRCELEIPYRWLLLGELLGL